VDRAAFEAFLGSNLYQGIASHPNIADLTMRDYAVDEEPTRVTRGLPAAVA
jgi:hypothetical protein